MKFTFTVTKKQIDKAFDKAVEQEQKEITVKGFRKGQAPKDMVIKTVGTDHLQQHAVELVLPEAYAEQITKKKLKPITYPKINLKKRLDNGDFEFEAEIAEMPEVKLGDYQKKLTGVLAVSKIWTPGKDDPKDAKEPVKSVQEQREENVQKIIEVLLKETKVEVPQLLIDDEVNRMLSRLLDQINKLGLKVEDYFASTGKTQAEVKTQYATSAAENLQLEFVLAEISKQEKIAVTPQEIQTFVESVPDEKMRQQLFSPESQANIQAMLLKQKVLQHLEKLAA